MLKLTQIRIDGGTQPRASINESVVSEYAEALTDGAKLPAVVVFHDGADYWLADGFHRYHANRKIGALDIDAEIKPGTKRDAVLYSVGANHAHGLRRSNEDKRNAVLTLLRDDEWMAWSDNKIAKACAVDHKTVASVRASILGISQDAAQAVRTVERGGKVYQQNTSNIGKKSVRPANEESAAQRATAPAATVAMEPVSDSRPVPAVKGGAAAPTTAPDDAGELDDSPSMEELLDEFEKENRQLNEVLKTLQADDTLAELAKLKHIQFGLEERLGQSMDKIKHLEKELGGLGRHLANLRDITGAASNSAAIAAVRALVKNGGAHG